MCTSAAALRLRPLLLPDCVCFSFCSTIASASAAAAPRLRPLQLLLPDCVRFCFSCCSTIASTSAAAPRLCPLQLLLHDCIHFSCRSPTASVSAAQSSSRRFQPLCEHSQSSRFSIFSVMVVHHYSLIQPPEHNTSVAHTHTNTWLKS